MRSTASDPPTVTEPQRSNQRPDVPQATTGCARQMTGRACQMTGRADRTVLRAREATTGRALGNDRTRQCQRPV
jgi:hypothetical protein